MKPRVEKTGFQAVTPKVAAAFRHKLEEGNPSPRIARIDQRGMRCWDSAAFFLSTLNPPQLSVLSPKAFGVPYLFPVSGFPSAFGIRHSASPATPTKSGEHANSESFREQRAFGVAKSLNRQSHRSPWRLAKCFLFPSALLVAFWQFSASALAQTAIISESGSCRTGSLVDGIDCITSEDQEKQPTPDGGNSLNSPDSTTDLDDSDGSFDDLSPDTSTGNYQDTPLFSVTALDAVTLRTLRIVPILLFPVHCFYCLHEHIRERAPPILA